MTVTNLKKALEYVEKLLKECKYKEVLDILTPVKEDGDYVNEESGYLVDYAIGVALYSMRINENRMLTVKEIDELRGYFFNTLKLNAAFVDNYLFMGLLYMERGELTGNRLDALQAIYYFKNLAEYKRGHAEERCQGLIKRIKLRHNIE